jgi:hypothetical protein
MYDGIAITNDWYVEPMFYFIFLFYLRPILIRKSTLQTSLSLVFYTIASFIIIQKLKKSHSLPRLEFYSGSAVVCANTHESADGALATGITQVFPDGHDHNTRAKLQSET